MVDSERQALNSQRAVIENDQQRLLAAVSLIKALGGGWDSGGNSDGAKAENVANATNVADVPKSAQQKETPVPAR